MRSGAEIVGDTLTGLGAECVFGLPGTQNAGLFSALGEAGLRTVVPTSELAASFMAGAYYRAAGRPGVLLTIPGPGFTYALTGLAEARLDSCAVVHVTIAPADAPGRAFQLQAIDQSAAAGALVKRVIEVPTAASISAALSEAWATAIGGEPGPVLVQLGSGVLRQSVAADAAETAVSRAARPAAAPPRSEDVVAAAAMLASANRPVLFLGQGAQNAADAVRRLAELLGAAVVSTTSGRGAIAEDHPLSLAFESAGTGASTLNEIFDRADVVVALGCKLSHNGSRGFALMIPESKLIHVDTSAEVLGANYPARVPVVADALAFAEALAARLSSGTPRRSAWLDEIPDWRRRARAECLARQLEPAFPEIEPPDAAGFFQGLREALPRHGIVATDSGLHQALARLHLPVLSPRGLLVPADFQSMGFGIPAAIAAKVASPERAVVAVVGDGGMAIGGLELLTARREGLDLTVFVFNDGHYGLIRLQQLGESGVAHGTALTNPDFAALARSLGVGYTRLAGRTAPALRAVFDRGGVNLVEVLLGDSPSFRRLRAKGSLRGLAKRGRRVAEAWRSALLRRR